jgi:hypothetical protein
MDPIDDPSGPGPDSLWTRPRRALRLGYALVIGGGILWIAVLQGAFGGLERRPGAFFMGLGFSMFGFAYLCFAVRCPRCGGRLFWEAVNKGRAGDWLGGSVRIGEYHECPSRASTRAQDAG